MTPRKLSIAHPLLILAVACAKPPSGRDKPLAPPSTLEVQVVHAAFCTPGDQSQPLPKTVRIQLALTFVSHLAGSAANPFYASLIDSRKRIFDGIPLTSEGALRAQILDAGEIAQGIVAFDVSRGSTELTLLYSAPLPGQPPPLRTNEIVVQIPGPIAKTCHSEAIRLPLNGKIGPAQDQRQRR